MRKSYNNISKKRSTFKTLTPLFMVIFIDAVGMSLIFPIFAPLFSLPATSGGIITWHISTTIKNMLYGLTMAIYPIFMFFFSPFLGSLSDQVGRKKVLLLCLLGSAIAAALSGCAVVVNSFILFFISRILGGSMAGSLPVAQAAITDISDGQNKTINMSLIGFAYILGFVLGPIIGGVLANKNTVSWFSFATPFFMTTLISLCNAAALVCTFHETLKITTKKISNKDIRLIKPLVMFIEAFQNKIIYGIALTTFFYILGWNAYMQFIVLYLFQKHNYSTMQLGYFVSWLAAIMSFAMLFIIRIMVKYFSTKQILRFSLTISIIGVLVCMVPSTAMQWLGVIPLACGVGLSYSTILTMFSNAVSNALQGWIMGVSSAVISAASGAAGLLVAIISREAIFAFISILLLWALSFFFSLKSLNHISK